MQDNVWPLILFAAAAIIVIGGLAMLSQHYTLDNIKSRTVGVLQIKVKHQNEKSPEKFARPKKGATNQTGEKALTGRGKIWLLKITFAR